MTVPGLRTIRYGGLLAAGVLALAGWLGGALPHGDLAATPASVWRGPHGPLILGGWLAAAATLAYLWWAVRDRVPSPRWAMTTITLWAAPFVAVPPMGSRDVYSYACQGHLFANGLNPYEAGVASLPCPWLDAVSPIWRDTPAPYGPLFVLIAAAAVLLGGSLTTVLLILRLLAVAGLLTIAACVPVLARRCGVPVQRALWVALAGPLVGMHLVGGPHNDALMIGLVVAGLAVLVAGARHPATQAAAGAILGLAVAIKITAVVVVPFAILIAVRRPDQRAAAWPAAGRVAGATGVTMLALTWASGLGIGWISGLAHTQDLIQFTSPPTAIGMTLTYAGQPLLPGFDAVPAVRLLALFLLAAVLAGLWLRSASDAGDPVRGALHGAALASAALIALAPSFHPWYLVFPLVLLGATTTRTDLVMAAGAAAALLVLPDGGGLARFAKFPGAPLMTILLVVLVVHRLRRVPRGTRRIPAFRNPARRSEPVGAGAGTAGPPAVEPGPQKPNLLV
ncbi:polyprenol phosphomannose-dependent alpha 1,6 mannosyltransferase MptB [Actinoplanes sp. NPDC049599]|uniref:polyprenol phosphomannose-dependent alpha 1,6 mannosyltransferase MptB n=1 Tax=Actinoplanes sp. NPDC049599 TaxID=3363903 RepID=UPI00379C5765